MTVSAWVLPSGRNNFKCETHWTGWSKLMPVPNVHRYKKCTHRQSWAHIHASAQHTVPINMYKWQEYSWWSIWMGVHPTGGNEVKWKGKIIPRKRSSALGFQEDERMWDYSIHTQTHTHIETGKTVVRTLLAIRHVSVQRRSIIDLNTQRQLL